MATPFERAAFLAAADAVREFELPTADVVESMTTQSKGKLLHAVAQLRHYLDSVERHVEGIDIPSFVFDLSNPVTVGEMVVHKLEQQPKHPLASLARFYGAGVYMLYYDGPSQVYAAITGTDCPIYAGSASPKNKIADTPRNQGMALHSRLSHHLNRSIAFAKTTLKSSHFHCRYLVVQSGLELAAEQFLMRRYHPVWNKEEGICPGFGKHGDKEDRQTELSKWDLLHPGRPFAKGQQVKTRPKHLASVTASSVKADIQGHFLKLLRDDPDFWKKRFEATWVKAQRIT